MTIENFQKRRVVSVFCHAIAEAGVTTCDNTVTKHFPVFVTGMRLRSTTVSSAPTCRSVTNFFTYFLWAMPTVATRIKGFLNKARVSPEPSSMHNLYLGR